MSDSLIDSLLEAELLQDTSFLPLVSVTLAFHVMSPFDKSQPSEITVAIIIFSLVSIDPEVVIDS